MKNIFECEHFGGKFYNKKECFDHEINEHGGLDKYKKIIYDILNKLNQKYNMNKSIDEKELNLNIYNSECDGFYYTEIYVSFDVDNYLIAACVSDDTIENIIESEMDKAFLKDINSIEGILQYEGWCGGHGADAYIINGIYLKDLLFNKSGKRIKIEIID